MEATHANGGGDSWSLCDELSVDDPTMYEIICKEKQRQRGCLEMIASENFASKSVLQALGSCMNNKYSEGQVGQRLVMSPFGMHVLDMLDPIKPLWDQAYLVHA